MRPNKTATIGIIAFLFIVVVAITIYDSYFYNKTSEEFFHDVKQLPYIEIKGNEEYVGFNKKVRILAEIKGINLQKATYKWIQIDGIPLNFISNYNYIEFVTPPLDKFVNKENNTPGPIKFSYKNRPSARFKVEVKDEKGGIVVSSEFTVHYAYQNPGWSRAPIGADLYFDAGRKEGPYNWEIVEIPAGVNIEIEGPNERYFRVKSNVPVRFILKEGISGKIFHVHFGIWLGNKGCGRAECHPVEYQGWEQTRMGTIFRRGINGELNKSYKPECIECHTVGFEPGIKQDGFDDIAKEIGWSFPSVLRVGNWEGIPFKLKDRTNVGCENCHGAGRFYTSYSVEVCARCHYRPPDYLKVEMWANSKMARSLEREEIKEKPSCARCHTTQGFVDDLRGHKRENANPQDVEIEYEPINCVACHDPHQNSERIIRYRGALSTQIPEVDWGSGTICIACHQGIKYPDELRETLLRPFKPRQPLARHPLDPEDRYRVIHAPQLTVLRGTEGYQFYGGPGSSDFLSPHISAPKGCVTCHMAEFKGDKRYYTKLGMHSFSMFIEEEGRRIENREGCKICHGKLDSLNRRVHLDYDGNGKKEGIFDETENLLNLLKKKIEDKIQEKNYIVGNQKGVSFKEYNFKIVLVDKDGNIVGGEKNPFKIPETDTLIIRAIYNYFLIKKDRSKGVHNPPFTIQLLQKTIWALDPNNIPNWEWR